MSATLAAIDSDVPETPPAAVRASDNADAIAGSDEQIDDVFRHVRERAAEVLVRLRAVDIGSVDEGTAVRPDASADEWPRPSLKDRGLPELEGDPSPMFDAGPMLGKEAWQVPGMGRKRSRTCR
jgi:hypothetical protein